ncbi:MAG: zf-HC2 domain-containing protein [Myxococcaceae bacterium]|nr:zf-HC2 domain-containing protein [Myxococcaceae bacterium]
MAEPMTCAQVFERMSDYLDGELTAPERLAVEAHLKGCEACAATNGELKATVEALRSHLRASNEAPAALKDRLKTLLVGVRGPG